MTKRNSNHSGGQEKLADIVGASDQAVRSSFLKKNNIIQSINIFEDEEQAYETDENSSQQKQFLIDMFYQR